MLVIASGRPTAPAVGTVSTLTVRSGRKKLTATPAEARLLLFSASSVCWLAASATAIT